MRSSLTISLASPRGNPGSTLDGFPCVHVRCVCVLCSGFSYVSLPSSEETVEAGNSFRELDHGLAAMPGLVKVEVKAIDGPNNGYVFEGMGTAQADDDFNEAYGGLLYGYSIDKIRLWAPKANPSGSFEAYDVGRIINNRQGWGGEYSVQGSQCASVRVTAQFVSAPDFDSYWKPIESQSNVNSYKKEEHGTSSLTVAVLSLLSVFDDFFS